MTEGLQASGFENAAPVSQSGGGRPKKGTKRRGSRRRGGSDVAKNAGIVGGAHRRGHKSRRRKSGHKKSARRH